MLLLASFQTSGQQPVYRHITEDDGLPDNEIYYLHQDRKGIIWISTNSGLCRYNGHSFQYFSSPLLKAKSTGCIQEDAAGRIWANNFIGQLFYVAGDSLVLFQLPGGKKPNSNAPFAIDSAGKLAVTTEQNELLICSPRHTQPKAAPQYDIDTLLQQGGINPFFASNGRLWSSVTKPQYIGQGIITAYSRQGIAQYYINGQSDTKTPHTGFIFEQDNHIYFFEREKSSLCKFNGSGFYEEKKLDLPGFKMVVPLQTGQLAFCTNNGLFIANQSGPGNMLELFPGQIISSFCEDSKGNLWVGTLTEGIYLIPRLGLTQMLPTQPGIDYTKVSTICKGPSNKLIIGFLNGELGVLEDGQHYRTLQAPNKMANKTQSVFYSPQLQLLNWQVSDKILQASFTETTTILKPGRGVGYASKDMAYIPKWQAVLLANPVDIQLVSLNNKSLANRIPGGWLKQYDSITIYDRTMPWPQFSILLSKERGRAVIYDESTEAMWGSDKNGITVYREQGNSNILLSGQSIYATHFCAHNGMVWTGTFSQGLLAIKNEKVVKQFLVQEGLASNTIYKIVGSGNHLWISTDKGLQYFDISSEEFYLLDKTIGLPSFKTNEIALVNGLLYIATPKGLLTIPDTVTFQKDPARRVYIQGIYCNNRLVDTLQPSFDTYNNDFVFKVETPVYSNRALLRYRYRLKGADRDFVITNLDKAMFEYKSLQSGSYRFELYLTDSRGNTIGPPLYYSFTIQPPFYKTLWFILLCGLAFASLIHWLVRRRIGQIKKNEHQKLVLAQMETDLKQSQLSGIKAQMNPHFMFNALNSIQEFILLNDKKQANMYMGKFADLMRMTLDMSNKQAVVLEDEIKMLELYLELEALRFEEHFNYTIRVDDSVDKENIHLPAMLIQPNIENAVKHGLLHKVGEKQLDIHFSIKNNHILCCTITDNGIGRKRSGEINAQRLNKHTSFATGATQKRLELLNHNSKQPIELTYEDLYDDHGNATGTKVTIHIPLL
jgi:Histidine kinase/Y_Y_Y domain/Two component regulator propeller